MASTCVTAFSVVLLVLQPWIALSYLWPPLYSPVSDYVCKEVVCGRGTCKPSNQSAFFLFECECDPGWKQDNFGLAENFKFLPCVVPDCTINYSCMNASSPVQVKGSRANESIFDPCHWTNCGGGFCNKSSNFTYSCECAKDYYNILNDTSLPCLQDCAIGTDCSTLGISSSNKSTSATPTVSNDDYVCKEVVCGKGTCKPSNQSAFSLFECECDPGWKQDNFGLAENFKFLPCVVPDCTINYSCMNASSPVQVNGSRANESIFDPCHWTNCGGGFCNKSSNFTYSCECAKDYYNILNDTSLPCLQDCAIGTDCSTLGISSSNKSTSATPTVSNDDDVCKGVLCGKGTCKPSNQSAFSLFECECDPGWKQDNFGLAENFKFLPCVVPDYELCRDVQCGKGTCKPSDQSAFFWFECECYPGWKQSRFGLAENFKFLPCVVPDCTINYYCMNASSNVQDKGSRANESTFDPCHWTDCGGGFCSKTSNFTYSCECAKDYYNILNDTSLPCFQDCAIGIDCSTLGISSSNKPASATQVLNDDGMNHATSILQGHSLWLITLMTFMAMVQWN